MCDAGTLEHQGTWLKCRPIMLWAAKLSTTALMLVISLYLPLWPACMKIKQLDGTPPCQRVKVNKTIYHFNRLRYKMQFHSNMLLNFIQKFGLEIIRIYSSNGVNVKHITWLIVYHCKAHLSVYFSDVVAPFFMDCPTSVFSVYMHTLPNFTEPSAADNSGLVLPLEVTPLGFNRNTSLSRSINVTYIARDAANLTDKCNVQIIVNGTHSTV